MNAEGQSAGSNLFPISHGKDHNAKGVCVICYIFEFVWMETRGDKNANNI